MMCACIPFRASAGPPFLTDDPEPTEPGHWEIYAPQLETAGRGAEFDGSAGVELNYGAAPGLQLTLGLPAAYAHDAGGWRWGVADIEASVKYQFYRDDDAGFSAAVFPGITLPTGSNGMSAREVSAFLPIWVQKDIGPWSVFGGGGYAINPGVGNRDYWTGGIALTRQAGKRLLLGIEADRQSTDTDDGVASTSLGIGGIYQLYSSLRLLASGGPTLEDGDGTAGFHAYAALGLNF
jgi:hypothetical protein